MGTGAEHYRQAERLVDLPNDANELKAAHVHAMLAVAAAMALWTTESKVGDSDEIIDWARLVQPKALGDGRMKWFSTGSDHDGWTSDEGTPRRGDVWIDEDGDHWLVQLDMSATGETVDDYPLHLACLDKRGGYSSWEAVCKTHGPLKLGSRPWLNVDNECPF